MNLLESVLLNEGFRERPYQDTKGVWTIGHGLTYITKQESQEIVIKRLLEIRRELYPKIFLLSPVRQDIIVEMAYQMGMAGIYKFKNMWEAIDRRDINGAAKEMLDSQWARSDSPARAHEMAECFLVG
jgi:lysozyme